jgi:protein required for attachment to host cells
MDIAWILVAHRNGAKVFEKQGRELNLLQEIPRAKDARSDDQPDAEKPVRTFYRLGGERQAAGSEQRQAAERETQRFIHELVELLEEGRLHKRYNKLVLVAESRLLGELRSELTRETEALISTTQNKDFAAMETQAIKKYLQDFTWPPPSQRY